MKVGVNGGQGGGYGFQTGGTNSGGESYGKLQVGGGSTGDHGMKVSVNGGQGGGYGFQTGGTNSGGESYGKLQVGGGSTGDHGMKVSVNGGQGGGYGFQTGGTNSGGGSYGQVQVGGGSTSANAMNGAKGERYGFQIGGWNNGGRGHSQVQGNGKNVNLQIGGRNGAMKIGGSQGGYFSWGTGGGHGNKLNDSISRNNGNGGGVMTYGGNGLVDNGIVNEDGVGNVGNTGVNEPAVVENSDGDSRHNGPSDVTGLNPHHSDGTIVSEYDNGFSHVTNPDQNVDHQNSYGAGSDSVDGERNSGNSNTAHDGVQGQGGTDSSNPSLGGGDVNSMFHSVKGNGENAGLNSMNGARNSENNEASHQDEESTPDQSMSNIAENGQTPNTIGINGKGGGSERIINDKVGNGAEGSGGGSQEGDGSDNGYTDDGNMVGNSQKDNGNEFWFRHGNKMGESGASGEEISTGNNTQVAIINGTGKPLSQIVTANEVYGNDNGGTTENAETTERYSNDGRIPGIAIYDHSSDIVNGNRNLDSVRLGSEIVTTSQQSGTWEVGKKNNISRQVGVNSELIKIRRWNRNGTRGYKAISNLHKKVITRNYGMVNDSNVGSSEKSNIIREDKSYASDFHKNKNGEKKDITVLHGKKSGKKGHHGMKWENRKDYVYTSRNYSGLKKPFMRHKKE